MMSHHKSQWGPMSHHAGKVDCLLSSLKIVGFRTSKTPDTIVRFQPLDRPLSPWIVCFDPKIVCFDPKRSSALTKDRLLLLGSSALTHGSSAFDLDRLLWSFSGSSALTLKDRLLSTLLVLAVINDLKTSCPNVSIINQNFVMKDL